jgi:hypothetical protein
MSHSRRAGARTQQRQAAQGPSREASGARAAPESSRLAPVRRRARVAKVGIAVGAVLALGASMGLARVSYPGHARHAVKTLSIPQPLYEVVRRNLLQAGILAPATAPPDAATSTS